MYKEPQICTESRTISNYKSAVGGGLFVALPGQHQRWPFATNICLDLYPRNSLLCGPRDVLLIPRLTSYISRCLAQVFVETFTPSRTIQVWMGYCYSPVTCPSVAHASSWCRNVRGIQTQTVSSLFRSRRESLDGQTTAGHPADLRDMAAYRPQVTSLPAPDFRTIVGG